MASVHPNFINWFDPNVIALAKKHGFNVYDPADRMAIEERWKIWGMDGREPQAEPEVTTLNKNGYDEGRRLVEGPDGIFR